MRMKPWQGELPRVCGKPIRTVDSHTEGETTRLIVGGLPEIKGADMAQKLAWFQEHLDRIRTRLTREPRGREILAAAVTDPVTDGAEFGLIYMDAKRYPFLCGHATMGAVATAIDAGWIKADGPVKPVTVDTPSGPMTCRAYLDGGRVEKVAVGMVPSFVLETGLPLKIPGAGQFTVHTVCVGGFFIMLSADQLDFELKPENAAQVINLGMKAIEEANRQIKVRHPLRPEVKTVDVIQFYDHSDLDQGVARSMVVYGEGILDRSPCGTGTTAGLTLAHHLGKYEAGRAFTSQSPLGTTFDARILKECMIGDLPGVEVEIQGSAYITGFHEYVVDPKDPLPDGFLLG